MIYCYRDDVTGLPAVTRYITPEGKILGLYDMLTSKLAYKTFTQAIHPIGVMVRTSYKLDCMFTDLLLDSMPEESVLEDIMQSFCEETADELIRVVSASEELKLHSGFTRIGSMNPAAQEYFREHMSIAAPMREGIMKTPEEPLAFSVPSYDELYSVYSTESLKNSESEDPDDADTQVVSSAASTNYFGEAQSDLGVLRDFLSLNPTIDKKHILVELPFRYYDSVCYREILADKNCPYQVPLSYVEGSKDMNLLDIQDNEQPYYSALVELIREGLARENKVTSDEEIDRLIEQGRTSYVVEAYLTDLANMAFQLNWAHTGTVIMPMNADAESDTTEGESEDSVSASVPGYYTVVYDASTKQGKVESKQDILDARIREFTFIDGFSRVKRYINFNTLNSYRWAEALIRLIRWGNRKPSCLCVKNKSKDRQEYLDLNTLEPTSFAGSLDELVPVVNPNTGNQLRIYGSVWMGYTPQSITDIDGINNAFRVTLPASPKYPVAVALATDYVDQKLFRLEFVDFFSFLVMVSKGALKVDGVSFDTSSNTFSVEADARAAFMRETMSLDMVLRCNIPDCHAVISPSTKLVHTLQALHGRLQNTKPVDINIFRVINSFYGLEKFDAALDVEQAFMIADATERDEALSEKRKFYADTFDHQVVKAVMREVVGPFMRFADKLMDTDGDVQARPLETLLIDAWDVQANSDANTSPVRRSLSKLPINPVFTAGIRYLQAISRIEAAIPGKPEPVLIGYIGQRKTETGGVASYFWAPEEYEYTKPVEKVLSVNDFWNRLYAQYLQLEKNGTYSRYHNKSLIPATDETFATLGRNAFIARKEMGL